MDTSTQGSPPNDVGSRPQLAFPQKIFKGKPPSWNTNYLRTRLKNASDSEMPKGVGPMDAHDTDSYMVDGMDI